MKKRKTTSLCISLLLTASIILTTFAHVPVYAAEETVEESESCLEEENTPESLDNNEPEAIEGLSDNGNSDQEMYQENEETIDSSQETGMKDTDDGEDTYEEIIVESIPTVSIPEKDGVQSENEPEVNGDPSLPLVQGTVTITTDGQAVQPEDKDGKDSEELFSDYVENAFKGQPSSSGRKGAKGTGLNLVGIDMAIYTRIAEYLPQIAAGERASTEFEIFVGDLGLEKTSWTAEELGVDRIFEVDEDGNIVEDENSNAIITQEAADAVMERTSYNLNLVINALLADHPYQLYWYDKTQDTVGTGFYMSAYYDEGIGDNVLEIVDSITISFPVAEEYSSGEYMVNTEIGQSVQIAVSNANAIVEQYSGASDYEKLCGYKDEICALVSYNNEAAEGGISYGNPWQMIWVFDGDSDTNVVCEGYAKAFKYLCDQSDFAGEIRCITVTGMMSGGTGEGPHMWNIVNMEDGNNYLVDLTNCDEGTIGEPDLLFLTGAASSESSNTYSFECAGETIVYVYGGDTVSLFEYDELAVIVGGKYPVEVIQNGIIDSGSCGDNLTWELDDKGILTISGTGVIEDHTSWLPYEVEKLVIKKGVTGIGDYGFAYCSSLTGVTIPNSVTSIGESAFFGCTGLQELNLPYGVTKIGSDAFAECSSLKAAHIPASLTDIGLHMFQRCTSLTEADLSEGLQEIGEAMFANCISLESITIPESVRTIGSSAFGECSALSHITIPSGVRTISGTIGNHFMGCENLVAIDVSPDNPVYKSIDGVLFSADESTIICCPPGKSGVYSIPDTVRIIGSYTFAQCDKLVEISIPDSVESIGIDSFVSCTGINTIVIPGNARFESDSPFGNCTSLQEIQIRGDCEAYYTIDGVLFLNTLLVDGKTYHNVLYCYPAGKPDTTYAVPEDTEMIDLLAISYNHNLKSIMLPTSLVKIGYGAFMYSSGLEQIVLPDSLETLGESAFYFCSALKSIVVPESVINIEGTHLFVGCNSLETIYCDIVSTMYRWAVSYGYVSKVDTGQGSVSEDVWKAIIVDDNSCMITQYSGTDVEVIIPEKIGEYTVTGIAESVFKNNNEIVSIDIPKSVTEIGAEAFMYCTSLRSVTLPDGLTEISERLFNNCSSLETIALPSSLTRIQGWSFQGCSSLVNVDIPNSVTEIGNCTFQSCNNLKTIHLPDQLKSIKSDMFSGCNQLESIVIPDGVTSIGIYAFENCYCLKQIVFPNNVTEIKENAFANVILTNVFYFGTEDEWSRISIDNRDDGNIGLLNSTVHFVVLDYAIPATCTSDGKTEGSHCSECGIALVEQEVIPATGHTIEIDEAVAPTATETGLTEGSHCSVCGEVIVAQEVIPAIGVPQGVISITEDPKDTSVKAGETAIFHIEATDSEGAELSYQWQWSANGTTWKNCTASGFNTDTFSFTMKTQYAGRQYRCIVSDETRTRTVISEVGTASLRTEAGITEQPSDISAAVGETARFHIAVTGESPRYQWQYSLNGTKWNNCTAAGYNTDTFSFVMQEKYAGRQYRCVITADGESLTSDVATANLKEEAGIIDQPEDTAVASGDTAQFHVEFSGDAPSYQWQWSSDGKVWKNCTGSSYNTDTFSFVMRAKYAGRQYRCVITAGGETYTSDSATVSLAEEPLIIESPVDVTVKEGLTASFHVGTSSSGVTYQWQWSSDGNTWKNCTGAGYSTDTFSFVTQSKYTGRRYRCMVTDGTKTEYSKTGLLTVSK